MNRLKRKDIREKILSINHSSEDFEINFVSVVDDYISNHDFKSDEDFLFCGRKKFLYDEFYEYLDNKEKHIKENPIRFAIINLEEFICDDNFISLTMDIDKRYWKNEEKLDGSVVAKLRDRNDKYSASGYICLEEKEYIVEMLNRIKKEMFRTDKFTYYEGEIKIVDCQCELCNHYNNGKRSDVCPVELLDKIIINEISCPVSAEENSFENIMKRIDSDSNNNQNT